eukprot:364754-Chlamydomonas_euryale.AAC.6
MDEDCLPRQVFDYPPPPPTTCRNGSACGGVVVELPHDDGAAGSVAAGWGCGCGWRTPDKVRYHQHCGVGRVAAEAAGTGALLGGMRGAVDALDIGRGPVAREECIRLCAKGLLSRCGAPPSLCMPYAACARRRCLRAQIKCTCCAVQCAVVTASCCMWDVPHTSPTQPWPSGQSLSTVGTAARQQSEHPSSLLGSFVSAGGAMQAKAGQAMHAKAGEAMHREASQAMQRRARGAMGAKGWLGHAGEG